MTAKKPPDPTISAIYAACQERRTCAEISHTTGINRSTAKVAIAWMVAYGHLLGHREADRVRYTHYSQGMPYAPSGTCVPQVGEWASFAELSKHWPCGIAVDAGEGARVIHGRAMSARVNGATTVVETAPTWDRRASFQTIRGRARCGQDKAAQRKAAQPGRARLRGARRGSAARARESARREVQAAKYCQAGAISGARARVVCEG